MLFSSGDFGDNFADFGLTAPNYPPTSPFVTAVGGTTLEVNAGNARQAEYGWSTAKQALCGPVPAKNCGSATTPSGSLAWQAGGGGGTSYIYTQPFYQAGVVPSALALRNQALFGPVPLRVEPDISMDADAAERDADRPDPDVPERASGTASSRRAAPALPPRCWPA